jgi:hypothetical protein
MSASARSDRVVFSNLFKKIEREIKQHEEDYIQLIIRSETMRTSTDDLPHADDQSDHQRTPPTPTPHLTPAQLTHKPTQPPLTNSLTCDSKLFLTNPAERPNPRKPTS